MVFKLPERKLLTKTQLQIINDLNSKKNRYFAVVGGPGTGKTVLAIHGINEIIQRNEEVVFIVYNKPLSEFIKESIEKNNANLNRKKIKQVVQTWHQWLWKMLAIYYPNPEELKNEFQIRDYDYDWDKVFLFIDKHKNEKGFKLETIFIDEAQDLPAELFNIIRLIVKNIYVYFDGNQKIEAKNSMDDSAIDGFLSVLYYLDLEEKFYDLTENYRNTKQIERVAKLFGSHYEANEITLSKITAFREGEIPILYRTTSIYATVENIINFYINGHLNSSVGVLLPKIDKENYVNLFEEYKNEFQRQIKEKKLNIKFHYYFRTSQNELNFQDSGIYFMTFKNSKGLEFDYVYMLEINSPSSCLVKKEDRNALYVAITRARENIFFVYDSNVKNNSIVDVLKQESDEKIVEEKDIKLYSVNKDIFI